MSLEDGLKPHQEHVRLIGQELPLQIRSPRHVLAIRGLLDGDPFRHCVCKPSKVDTEFKYCLLLVPPRHDNGSLDKVDGMAAVNIIDSSFIFLFDLDNLVVVVVVNQGSLSSVSQGGKTGKGPSRGPHFFNNCHKKEITNFYRLYR